MAMVSYELLPETKLTKEQKLELSNARKLEITYDDDSPRLTDAQLDEFKKIAKLQREERKRKVVSLRIKQETLEKAKLLGKGYTSILARMLDFCIDDSDILKKCL